jgi:hypothetical protein
LRCVLLSFPKKTECHHAGDKETAMEVSQTDIKIHEAQTARQLAIALSCALGVSVLLQYLVLAALTLCGRQECVPVFEHLFNAWLPVISGLTGSAVTFYLTKRPALRSKQREGGEATPGLRPILPWGELHHNAPQVKDSCNFREELAKGVLETLNEKFV